MAREKGIAAPALLLIMSRLCVNLEQSTISYVVSDMSYHCHLSKLVDDSNS